MRVHPGLVMTTSFELLRLKITKATMTMTVFARVLVQNSSAVMRKKKNLAEQFISRWMSM